MVVSFLIFRNDPNLPPLALSFTAAQDGCGQYSLDKFFLQKRKDVPSDDTLQRTSNPTRRVQAPQKMRAPTSKQSQ